MTCYKCWITSLLVFVFFNATAQEIPKLRIDIDRSFGGAVSDYFSSVEYIPLQTTKESLFGQISNLIITASSFVITDRDTKSVLFFAANGKFIKRITKNGSLVATGAIYNAQNNTINIAFEDLDNKKVTIDSYSTLGVFIAKGEISKSSAQFMRNRIGQAGNSYWLRNQINPDSLANFNFLTEYRNGKKVSSLIPFATTNSYSLARLINELGYINLPVIYHNNFYFATPIEHSIYKVSLDNGKSEPLYQMVFPASYGLKSELLNLNSKKALDSAIRTKWYAEKTILSLENIIYDNTKLLFKIKTGYFGFYATDGTVTARNFLYRFQDNLLVAFEKIYPDAASYFLPILDPKMVSFNGLAFENNHIYTHISSLLLFAAHEALKAKGVQYPPTLKDYFEKQNRKSNPVVVRMKLKE